MKASLHPQTISKCPWVGSRAFARGRAGWSFAGFERVGGLGCGPSIMVRPEQFFDSQNLDAALERWVEPDGSQRILILLNGPVRALSDEVRLRSAPGRQVQVRAGAREGARALALALLGEGGRIETAPDPSPGRAAAGWAPLKTVLSEARVRAESLRDFISPLGGLGAVLRLEPGELERRTNLPNIAHDVARLADGRRSIARVLAESGADELLVARVINRLHVEGIVTPLGPDDDEDPLLPAPRLEGSQFDMPERGWGQTSALPETDMDEFEGQAVRTDLRQWLHAEGAPPTLLSEEAFNNAYSQDVPLTSTAPTVAPSPSDAPAEVSTPVAAPPVDAGPTVEDPAPAPNLSIAPEPARPERDPGVERVRQGVPFTTGRPTPNDDDALLRDAGVGGGSAGWILGAFVLLLVGGLAYWMGVAEPTTPIPAAPPPVVPTSTVSTATVATATVATASVAEDAPSADGMRATVAAPDAPEVVRRAESLIVAERYGQADRLLKRLRRTRPDDPAVLILSGMVYVDTNRLKSAGTMADRALAMDRRSFRAWVLKGSVLQFQRRNAEALKAYQRALKLGPDHPMSGQLRAVIGALER